MNKINLPHENNLRYKDVDLNKKIGEYNNIYNNNSINININKSKNSHSFSKSINSTNKNININSISEKEQTTKITTDNKIKNNANINNFVPGCDKFSILQLSDLLSKENQYNSDINDLKNQLLKARTERKEKEKEAALIHHRLTKLKNKEQSKLLQFKIMKAHINKILNNRKKAKENLIIKMQERNKFKSMVNSSMSSGFPMYNIKKNLTSTNFFKQSKKDNIMNKSQNNFYRNKLDNNDFDNKNQNNNINIDNINIDNFNIEDDDNNNNIDINIIKNNNSKDSIQIFKQKLIEKIKKDEEEKKRIEDEIAKIEEEENNLLNKFNKKI